MLPKLAAQLAFLETHPAQGMPEAIFLRAKAIAQQLQLNHPAKKTVVITGTNGKGTAAHCLQALALAHDLRVGLLTSPHLVVPNERIRVNGKSIDDQDFLDALNAVVETTIEGVGYSQTITLAALWWFKQLNLDLAILEVGVGGRFDATNTIDNDAVIITNIALDHCAQLGNTRELIAREKVQLVKRNGKVIVGDQAPPSTLQERVIEQQAQVAYLGKTFFCDIQEQTWDLQLPQLGWKHLARTALIPSNLSVAIQAFEWLYPQQLEEALLRTTLKTLCVPGRCQFRHYQGKQWLFDVAHNDDGVAHLVTFVRRQVTSWNKIYALFYAKPDKPIDKMIGLMDEIVDEWFFYDHSLMQNFRQQKISCYHESSDWEASLCAVQQRASAKDLIIVCGSFLLVGAVYQQWGVE